jgi:hypothetical protein
MFCPDCGAENVRSQKFCVRCGSNLVAIDRAREIIGDVVAGSVQNEGVPSHVLRIIALISICAFFCITAGTVFLALIESDSPAPFFFGTGGFIALVLICRQLLRASGSSRTTPVVSRTAVPPTPPATLARAATNRGLGAAAVPFQSITEDSTRQFENARGNQE